MAFNDSKRYYWLKLKKDFFQQHQLKVLKALPNGRLYALIYLELLAESTSHNGELRFSQTIPYDSVTLASVIDEDKDNLEKAIEVLSQLELVEILEDKTIYMIEMEKLIGSETGSAERQREYRKKLKGDNVALLSQDCSQEKREKKKEERDKSKEKHRYGAYQHVMLTDDERKKLDDKYGSYYAELCVQYLDEYIEMKGYKAKNHYLCILKWVVDAVERDQAKVGKNQNIQYTKTDIVPDYTGSNTCIDTSNLDQFLKERKEKC